MSHTTTVDLCNDCIKTLTTTHQKHRPKVGRPKDPVVQEKINQAASLLAQGLTYRAVADQLCLSIGSVCRAKQQLLLKTKTSRP